MTPVVLIHDGPYAVAHREGCADTRGNTDAESGWDVTDYADLIEQAYGLEDGETVDDYRDTVMVARCLRGAL